MGQKFDYSSLRSYLREQKAAENPAPTPESQHVAEQVRAGRQPGDPAYGLGPEGVVIGPHDANRAPQSAPGGDLPSSGIRAKSGRGVDRHIEGPPARSPEPLDLSLTKSRNDLLRRTLAAESDMQPTEAKPVPFRGPEDVDKLSPAARAKAIEMARDKSRQMSMLERSQGLQPTTDKGDPVAELEAAREREARGEGAVSKGEQLRAAAVGQRERYEAGEDYRTAFDKAATSLIYVPGKGVILDVNKMKNEMQKLSLHKALREAGMSLPQYETLRPHDAMIDAIAKADALRKKGRDEEAQALEDAAGSRQAVNQAREWTDVTQAAEAYRSQWAEKVQGTMRGIPVVGKGGSPSPTKVLEGEADIDIIGRMPGFESLPEAIRTSAPMVTARAISAPANTYEAKRIHGDSASEFAVTGRELRSESFLHSFGRLAGSTAIGAAARQAVLNPELDNVMSTMAGDFVNEDYVAYIMSGGEIIDALPYLQELARRRVRESEVLPDAIKNDTWMQEQAANYMTGWAVGLILIEPDPVSLGVAGPGAAAQKGAKVLRGWRMADAAKLDTIVTAEKVRASSATEVSRQLQRRDDIAHRLWQDETIAVMSEAVDETLQYRRAELVGEADPSYKVGGGEVGPYVDQMMSRAPRTKKAIEDGEEALTKLKTDFEAQATETGVAHADYAGKVDEWATHERDAEQLRKTYETQAQLHGVDTKTASRKQWAQAHERVTEELSEIIQAERKLNLSNSAKFRREKAGHSAVQTANQELATNAPALEQAIKKGQEHVKALQQSKAGAGANRTAINAKIKGTNQQIKDLRAERKALQNDVKEAKKYLRQVQAEHKKFHQERKKLANRKKKARTREAELRPYVQLQAHRDAWVAKVKEAKEAETAMRKALGPMKKAGKGAEKAYWSLVKKFKAETKNWSNAAYEEILPQIMEDVAKAQAESYRTMAAAIRKNEDKINLIYQRSLIGEAGVGRVGDDVIFHPEKVRESIRAGLGDVVDRAMKESTAKHSFPKLKKVWDDADAMGGTEASYRLTIDEVGELHNEIRTLERRGEQLLEREAGLTRGTAYENALQARPAGKFWSNLRQDPGRALRMEASTMAHRFIRNFDQSRERVGDYSKSVHGAMEAGENILATGLDEMLQLTNAAAKADIPISQVVFQYADGKAMKVTNGSTVVNLLGPGLYKKAKAQILADTRMSPEELNSLLAQAEKIEAEGGDVIGWLERNMDPHQRGVPLMALGLMYLPSGTQVPPTRAIQLIRAARKNLEEADDFRAFTQLQAHATQGYAPKGEFVMSTDHQVHSLGFGVRALTTAVALDETAILLNRAIGGVIDPDQALAMNKLMAGDAALGGEEAFLNALEGFNRMGMPMHQRTWQQARDLSVVSKKLVQVGEGGGFVPINMVRRVEEAAGDIVKEVEWRHQRDGWLSTAGNGFAYGVSTWKTALITGHGVPNPRYWTNNIFGDFSQLMIGQGIVDATRLTFQNLPTNLPYVGRRMHDFGSEMAKKHHGKPVLGTLTNAVFNPHLSDVFNGRKGHILTETGEVLPYKALRTEIEELGVGSTHVHEELLEVFTRNAEQDGWMHRKMRERNLTISQHAQAVQQRQRAALYIDLRQKGMPPKEAAQKVKDALYDWKHGMTQAEAKFLGTLIPFYRFWRLATTQLMKGLTEAFTRPSREFLKRAATGQTMMARYRQQGLLTAGLSDLITGGPQLPEDVGDYEEMDYLASRIYPSWMSPRPKLAQTPLDMETMHYLQTQQGKLYTHKTTVLPPLTAVDIMTLWQGTAWLFAAWAQGGPEETLSHLAGEKAIGPLVSTTFPWIEEPAAAVLNQWRLQPGQGWKSYMQTPSLGQLHTLQALQWTMGNDALVHWEESKTAPLGRAPRIDPPTKMFMEMCGFVPGLGMIQQSPTWVSDLYSKNPAAQKWAASEGSAFTLGKAWKYAPDTIWTAGKNVTNLGEEYYYNPYRELEHRARIARDEWGTFYDVEERLDQPTPWEVDPAVYERDPHKRR